MTTDLTALHTNEGGEAALTAALAQCPEDARIIITSCFALLLRQQDCFLTALENQPAYLPIIRLDETKTEAEVFKIELQWQGAEREDLRHALVLQREPLLKLIREYRGEPPAEPASPPTSGCQHDWAETTEESVLKTGKALICKK